MDAPECHHFQNGGLSRNEFDKLDGGDFIIRLNSNVELFEIVERGWFSTLKDRVINMSAC